MKILFSLKGTPESRRQSGVVDAPAYEFWYERYIADVEITWADQKIVLDSTPMVYFLTMLRNALLESFITERASIDLMWDTGWAFFLSVDGERVFFELPQGAGRNEVPLGEFATALKVATLEFLRAIKQDEPTLLQRADLFPPQSIQRFAAELLFPELYHLELFSSRGTGGRLDGSPHNDASSD